MIPQPGKVRIQAVTISPTIPQLTDDKRFAAPTPIMAVVLVCVVLTGIPVSTTHTKTTAIMGVGAEKRVSSVDWGIVKEMVFAWVMTFPGCGIIGYLMAKLFIWFSKKKCEVLSYGKEQQLRLF